jgi:hypothetical protein
VTDRLIDRIDAALQKMAFQGLEVRAIYLTISDHDQLDAELNAEQDYTSAHLSFRGHHIRGGERSMIYSIHGVSRAIPVRLSARTKARAA